MTEQFNIFTFLRGFCRSNLVDEFILVRLTRRNFIAPRKNERVFAFTLAEVLITLGIIGIVAAITIPILMQNIQDQQLKTAWKKEYSVISQAVQSVVSDNGGSLKGVCTEPTGYCILSFLSEKLKLLKLCQNGQTKGSCWHEDNIAKNYGGGTDWVTKYSIAHTGMVLQDGTMMTIWWPDGSCSSSGMAPEKQSCGWMVVDVNGFKPPNIQGKDIFILAIHENWVTPEGTQGDWVSTNISTHICDSALDEYHSGLGCSAQYLYK